MTYILKHISLNTMPEALTDIFEEIYSDACHIL